MKYIYFWTFTWRAFQFHVKISNFIYGFAFPNHNIFSTRTLCKPECDLDPQIYSQSMHMWTDLKTKLSKGEIFQSSNFPWKRLLEYLPLSTPHEWGQHLEPAYLLCRLKLKVEDMINKLYDYWRENFMLDLPIPSSTLLSWIILVV